MKALIPSATIMRAPSQTSCWSGLTWTISTAVPSSPALRNTT